MKALLVAVTLVVLTQFFSVTPIAFAADASGISQLAQCSGPDCSACNVVYLANGLITWLIGFAFLLFAVLFCIAGVRMVTSGGNSHTVEEAKGSFINAIVGLIIILSAWLIVDTIMRGLVGTAGHAGQLVSTGSASGWLFWSEVQCQVQIVPDKATQWENPDTQEYFTSVGMNSYQVYVYNTAGSCRQVSNSSFPDIAMCQNALSSVTRSGQVYVVQDCSGNPGGSTPSWMSAPVCGMATTPGGGMTLSLTGGGSETVKPCDPSSMGTVSFLGGSVQINKHLIPSAQRIDARWRSMGGNSFYNVTSVGGYNCRNIAGTNSQSMHAYGLAIDINPAQNPKGPTLVTNMPSAFISILTNEGWGWGGNWHSSKDAMHFSKAINEQGNMTGE